MSDSVYSNPFVPEPEAFQPFQDDFVHQSVAEAFERSVQKHADRIAIHLNGPDITYRELDELTDQLAFQIVERVGDEEEPVAVLVEQGLSQIVAILAILKAGKIYAVMDLSNPPERLASMLNDLGGRLIVTSSTHSTFAQSVSVGAVILEMDKLDGGGKVLVHRPFDSQAGVYYTSGSTGQPKGVIYSQRNILHFTMTVINLYCMNRNDRQPLPFSGSFAWSISPMFATLLCGATLYPIDLREMNMQALAGRLEENGITMLQLSSSLFRQFMGVLDKEKRHFPQLRILIASGEPLNAQDVRAWQALFSPATKLGCALASTEASVITFHTFGVDSPVTEGIIPLGYPTQDKEVLIVDEERRPLPAGETGEIAIRSEYLVYGYWQKPELTNVVFQKDAVDPSKRIYYSNDLGRFLPDGKLEHLGRKDNLVKIRAYSVDLMEVEQAIYDLQDVTQVVVIADSARHDLSQKQLVAYLVAGPTLTRDPAELRSKLARKLPAYMIPPFFVFLDSMPLNINGKVDKKALLPIDHTRELQEDDFPLDDIEKRLVSIWKKVFNLEKISVHDNFFDLGGDSLLAISIFLYIERSFSRRFPSSIFLQYPTIRSLAPLLRENQTDNPSSIIAVQPLGDKTPLFWIPSGFGVDLYVQGMAKYLAPDQPLYLLTVPNVPGDQFFLIEELAKIYARAIQQFLPQGPYYLVGHSFGGTIASETARELVRSGGKVCWVGMLDSVPPDASSATLFQYLRLFIKNIPALGFARSLKDLGRNVFVLFAMFMLKPQWIRERVLQKRKIPVVNMLGIRESAYVKSFFIGELYHPEPYPFDLLVFRATGVHRYSIEDLTAGWERSTVNGLRYVDVPGDHVSMMEEPNIGVLARKICEQANASEPG